MTSKVEQTVLNSKNPIKIDELTSEQVVVDGVKAVVLNKSETANIKNIDEYKLNQDKNPKVIKKKPACCVNLKQEVAVRTLKPNKQAPKPGKLIIRQEADVVLPEAPPLVVRQVAERVKTPPPLVIRQEPPQVPVIPEKVILVPGKVVYPDRRLVVEKLPDVPAKPQKIIIEKWLPFPKVKRNIRYEKAQPVEPIPPPERNIVIEWDSPNVITHKDVKIVGVFETDPEDYKNKYKFKTKINELPSVVKEIGLDFTKPKKEEKTVEHVLSGDIDALNLIDLDQWGLGEYKKYLLDLNKTQNGKTSEAKNKPKAKNTKARKPSISKSTQTKESPAPSTTSSKARSVPPTPKGTPNKLPTKEMLYVIEEFLTTDLPAIKE